MCVDGLSVVPYSSLYHLLVGIDMVFSSVILIASIQINQKGPNEAMEFNSDD